MSSKACPNLQVKRGKKEISEETQPRYFVMKYKYSILYKIEWKYVENFNSLREPFFWPSEKHGLECVLVNVTNRREYASSDVSN
jgi:hypothetical protein